MDETTVVFDTRKYLTSILNSYHNNWCDIRYQFELDFPRSKILYNLSETSVDELYSNVNKIVIVLCTQAALYLSYSLVSLLYSDFASDVVVFDYISDNNYTCITDLSNSTVEIHISHSFILKNTRTFINLNIIRTMLEITLPSVDTEHVHDYITHAFAELHTNAILTWWIVNA